MYKIYYVIDSNMKPVTLSLNWSVEDNIFDHHDDCRIKFRNFLVQTIIIYIFFKPATHATYFTPPEDRKYWITSLRGASFNADSVVFFKTTDRYPISTYIFVLILYPIHVTGRIFNCQIGWKVWSFNTAVCQRLGRSVTCGAKYMFLYHYRGVLNWEKSLNVK